MLPTQALLLCDRLRLRVLENADDDVDADDDDDKSVEPLAQVELRMSHMLVETEVVDDSDEEGEEEKEEEAMEGDVKRTSSIQSRTLDSNGAEKKKVSTSGLAGGGASVAAAAFGPAFVNFYRDHRRKCKSEQ